MRALYRRRFARLPVGRRPLPRHGRERPRPGAAAIHRPLLHRRLSDPPDRPHGRHAAASVHARRSGLVTPTTRTRSSSVPWTKPLSNRVAVVTGASRGIGRAAALALAEAGAHVIALARTEGGAGGARRRDPRRAARRRSCRIDLKDIDAIDRLGAAIHERWGKLDILLGNAGHARRALADRPYRPAGLGRGDGRQRHRQLAPDPLAGPAAARLRCRPRDLRDLRRRP